MTAAAVSPITGSAELNVETLEDFRLLAAADDASNSFFDETHQRLIASGRYTINLPVEVGGGGLDLFQTARRQRLLAQYATAPALASCIHLYRIGPGGRSLSFGIAHSAVGAILVAATSKGICRVLVGDDSAGMIEELRSEYPDATISQSDDTSELARNIVAGVERGQSISALPLAIQGTAFQQRVWDALRQIPAGSTRTYGEIAASIGEPTAARAVANACAANPTAVVIPCHRVVRGDGSLGGYRWGTRQKQRLLELEQPQHLPAKDQQ